ncbi:Pumiliofamily RNA binding repeat [Leishmania braziliensis]|nr:Pumiliofamily RNA binding repeat [Leishmania braziliensis]
MSGASKNFYASMVLKSNYPDAQPLTSTGVPLKKGQQPYRSSHYSSATANPSAFPVLTQPLALPVGLQSPQTLPANVLRPTVLIPTASHESSDSSKHSAKMYTHNPYASTCTTPSTYLSQSTSMESGTFASPYATVTAPRASAITLPHSSGASTFPVYAASEGSCGEAGALANMLEDQFLSILGNIPSTAMSSRGRHILLNVLRLQHIDKIQMIYDELVPQFNTVAMDQHGCHVARTLIEYISTPQMEALVPYIDPKVIRQMATTTQHTRRVLQAVFEHHKSDALMPIVEVVTSDCQLLSVTQQGCIAIIRIIEYAKPAQKRTLISALVPLLSTLAKNQFGNYVVQCILKNIEGYVSLNDLAGSFQGHWVELSCDKYSSNVMEKIVGMLKGTLRQRIVNELIFDVTHLQCLMQNSFGNYVLQAMIGSAVNQYEYGLIYDAVTPLLHTSPYGHRIEAKLKGRYDALYSKPVPAIATPVDATSK